MMIQMTINAKQTNEKVISMEVDTEKNEVKFLAEGKETARQENKHVGRPSEGEVPTFLEFMSQIIEGKSRKGKARTAEAYRSALHSFERYLDGKPMALVDIDEEMMDDYEKYLKTQAICMNTMSFYMRIIKAVYNHGVKQGLVDDKEPFKNVYTGVAKTRKRALNLETLRQIRDIKGEDEKEQFAIDMFLFSFYTRGMSFVDMAYLRKSDIKNGSLEYSRKKTGQRIFIKWEQPMQDIIDRNPSLNDTYLLPIIRKPGKSERSQYRYSQYLINRCLNKVGERLNLSCDLTMYVARHSWASIARSIDIPLGVISEAMGHSSEKMTTIYLKSIDEARIDTENKKIIDLLK